MHPWVAPHSEEEKEGCLEERMEMNLEPAEDLLCACASIVDANKVADFLSQLLMAIPKRR
jgi:hypothetical protein